MKADDQLKLLWEGAARAMWRQLEPKVDHLVSDAQIKEYAIAFFEMGYTMGAEFEHNRKRVPERH